MAYTKFIDKNSKDSHQTSPAYMLTFLRWSNRDTYNFADADQLELRDPLIVISDCISLAVSSHKSSHLHQSQMVLMGGDINYATALAPGDFVLINMLDNDKYLFGEGGTPKNPTSKSLYSRATSLKPINELHDGFKGVFKIDSVRKTLSIDAGSGTKMLTYQVSATAFTEFDQVIYFNPYLVSQNDQKLISEIINSKAHVEWAQNTKKLGSLNSLFFALVGFLIGSGFQELNDKIEKKEVVKNFNKNFLMPSKLAKLMGVKSSETLTASKFFRYLVGIQTYSSSGKGVAGNVTKQEESEGLNPSSYGTLSGSSPIQPEPFCQVTAWSVLSQYSNSLINEMYTAFKLTHENKIMPCVVFRQKPFTSKKFKTSNPNIPATPFLSLPRWKISLNLIKSMSLGRSNTARINFVHVIGKVRWTQFNSQTAQQSSLNAYKADIEDIKRSGLRPFITGCDFDFPTDENKNSLSPIWNELVFDWLSNGHLKENGTIICAGIEEPIAVGDNLELEDTVYHIESVMHSMHTHGNGYKSFETTLTLSYGVDKRDRTYNPIYPEMQYTDTESYRKDNYEKGYKSMPGFSDTQDVAGRVDGEEISKTKEKAFSLIPKSIKNTDKKS